MADLLFLVVFVYLLTIKVLSIKPWASLMLGSLPTALSPQFPNLPLRKKLFGFCNKNALAGMGGGVEVGVFL